LDIGAWKILAHKNWGRYIVRMRVVEGEVAIADVRGVHAAYDAHLGIMSSGLSIGGLISFGGQKLALSGTHTTGTTQQEVVIYRPREDACAKALILFRDEMRMMRNLGSVERVLRISHINEEGGWALAERCDGSIHRLMCTVGIHNRRQTAMDLLRGCAAALVEVHKVRVVHRDVKAGNFLYKRVKKTEGNVYDVKIADFGLAVALAPNMNTTTGDVGTRYYKAPEIKPYVSYGMEVDVYAFGVMIWEFVYNQRRSSQLEKARSDYSKRKKNHKYNTISGYAEKYCTPPLTGEYGSEIDSIISLCTHKLPKERPTMIKVLDKLMSTYIHQPTQVIVRTTPKLAFASVFSDE
jgi:serine/threonine protein kinase